MQRPVAEGEATQVDGLRRCFRSRHSRTWPWHDLPHVKGEVTHTQPLLSLRSLSLSLFHVLFAPERNRVPFESPRRCVYRWRKRRPAVPPSATGFNETLHSGQGSRAKFITRWLASRGWTRRLLRSFQLLLPFPFVSRRCSFLDLQDIAGYREPIREPRFSNESRRVSRRFPEFHGSTFLGVSKTRRRSIRTSTICIRYNYITRYLYKTAVQTARSSRSVVRIETNCVRTFDCLSQSTGSVLIPSRDLAGSRRSDGPVYLFYDWPSIWILQYCCWLSLHRVAQSDILSYSFKNRA